LEPYVEEYWKSNNLCLGKKRDFLLLGGKTNKRNRACAAQSHRRSSDLKKGKRTGRACSSKNEKRKMKNVTFRDGVPYIQQGEGKISGRGHPLRGKRGMQGWGG